jgi:hypothetical protein
VTRRLPLNPHHPSAPDGRRRASGAIAVDAGLVRRSLAVAGDHHPAARPLTALAVRTAKGRRIVCDAQSRRRSAASSSPSLVLDNNGPAGLRIDGAALAWRQQEVRRKRKARAGPGPCKERPHVLIVPGLWHPLSLVLPAPVMVGRGLPTGAKVICSAKPSRSRSSSRIDRAIVSWLS